MRLQIADHDRGYRRSRKSDRGRFRCVVDEFHDLRIGVSVAAVVSLSGLVICSATPGLAGAWRRRCLPARSGVIGVPPETIVQSLSGRHITDSGRDGRKVGVGAVFGRDPGHNAFITDVDVTGVPCRTRSTP